MDEFEASNGVTVEQFTESLDVRDDTGSEWLPPRLVEALGEFFQHERDEGLGRWRWPEYPDYVVYPDTDANYIDQPAVIVLHEPTGKTAWASRYGQQDMSGTGAPLRFEAADAYWAAHPEPKPWQDAEPGEVWELTMRPGICDRFNPTLFRAVKREIGGIDFHSVEPEYVVTHIGQDAAVITAGRRIWPEGS